ncbi:hypothetical protein CF326_g1537 [Tilletia indica]|nr:hypothetical protein CF326_g1537 [Tilletia indica]
MRIPDASRPNKPPCRYFNTSRGCNKGDNCPFAHVHSQPGSAQSARVSSPPQARFTERATSQPLSEAQIKTFHDATSDDLVPLHIAPTDVQDKLYPFLNQNFSFNHPKVVNNFARMLAASGSGDDRWTFTERSAFLSRLSDPNKAGLDRIKEILLMPIATRSAFSQDLLFQNGMVLIFMFFTSSTVVKTAVASSANLLYGIIDSYLVAILSASQEGVRQLIESRGHHLKGSDTTSMVQIFKPLILLINEYLNRFPAAALSHFDSLTMFLSALASSLDQWAQLFLDGSFQDQVSCVGAARERWVNFVKKSLQEKIIKIQSTLEFAHSSATLRPLQTGPSSTARTVSVGEGQLQMLINEFDPPGLLRALGPRHNNDSVLIRDIVVHPTSQEIASTQAPYLPFNFIGAPHHLRSGSPEQLLDIHFRLLREELVEPLRSSMMALSQEIRSCGKGSTLQQLLNKGGGRFKAGNDCADLQVWGTGRLRFSDITCSDRHGILVTVGFEKQQSQKAWDFQLERLLNPGALVAIVQRVGEGEEVEVYLGLVRSHPAEIKDAVRSQMPAVKIEFFDKRAIHLAISPTSSTRLQLLVEVRGVLYESVAPFLRNLQETAPGQLSFAELLTLPSSMPTSPVMVQPPSYAQSPAFSYNLSGLLREDSPRSSEGLYMTIDEEGRDNARAALKEHGIVDSTQADAVVDALSREVAIIQGPPGTGKSYVGVALINALLKSNVSPILIVCMTNHALDSVLSKILEQDLTKKIVRLGSRSKDERVASYSLEALVAVRPKDDDRDAKREWRRFKTAQEDLLNDVSTMKKGSFDAAQVLDMAETINPIHAGRMKDPPTDLWPAISDWITWSSGKARGTHATMSSQPDAIDIFEFWRQGVDLELRQRQRSAPQEPKVKAQQSKGKEKETVAVQNRYEVLAEASDSESDEEELWPCDIEDDDDDDDDPFEPLELETDGSTEYTTDSVVAEESDEDPSQSNFALSWPEVKHRGSLELLQEDADVWTFSMEDRALLIDQWTNECRQVALSRLDDAYDKVQSTRKGVQEQRDKERLSILKTSHIIGATTNGAAKAADLLKSLKPKVLLVEEAGQVLEAHILATLNASVEHLILIGDHYQLRPQVTNFGLSMENKRGRGHLHRLDMSMMERLAEESKVPVSRIITQRRMRPEICDLVRPVQELEDHESVQNRGDIKGVAKNYFFLDHNHPESAQETSRTNEFEADMAFDLVCHLLNQGYVPNDICIIVAYLSQISKIKERLRRHQISIIVPDKDAAALADAEEGDHGADFHSEGVVVTQSVGTAVRVATVDNFQGEEAKIIILSLVRNRGVDSDEQLASSRFLRKGGIGFLKSQNRSYVALSRARDGLFVFGNAGLLHDHSPFWAAVLDRMEAQGAIVQGIPIICSHHPEKGVTEVSEAGKLRLLSPNGAKLSISAKRSVRSDVVNVLAAILPVRGAVESRARYAWLNASGVASTESDNVPILVECHASDSLATSPATLC